MNGEPQLVKILLIGDSGAGKSSLLRRYLDDSFSNTFISTLGLDFKIKTITIAGQRLKLQIWDTAGQERFRTITTAYYRGANGIILVYDVTDESTFKNVRGWMKNIELNANSEVNRLLVGNKCDMVAEKLVDTARGQQLAELYDVPFFETSAKTNVNVAEVFEAIAAAVKRRLDANAAKKQIAADLDNQAKVRLDRDIPKQPSSCCS